MTQKCEAGHQSHDIKQVDTSQGEFFIYDWQKYKDFEGYCTGQDDVSRTLENIGTWESKETELIRSILLHGTGSWVIDIGAHIGWYTILAAELGYEVEYIEADEENIETLKKNAVLHGQSGKIFGWHKWIGEGVKPIDRLSVELIKIDIEGNERYAIDLVEPILHNHQANHIFMEVSPIFNGSYPKLVKRIESYGYKAFKDEQPFDYKYDFDQTNLLFKKND